MFAQELAEHDFRLARRVEVGGVKEIDSRADRLDDHGSRTLPIDFVDRRLRWIAAERHGAESQAGNDQTAIAEASLLHRNTSLIENRLVLSLPAAAQRFVNCAESRRRIGFALRQLILRLQHPRFGVEHGQKIRNAVRQPFGSVSLVFTPMNRAARMISIKLLAAIPSNLKRKSTTRKEQ